MPYINPEVLITGLQILASTWVPLRSQAVWVCSVVPTDPSTASSYRLGTTFSPPFVSVPDLTSAAFPPIATPGVYVEVAAGPILFDYAGTAVGWALMDGTGSLLASGDLFTPQTVGASETKSLEVFTITLPGA